MSEIWANAPTIAILLYIAFELVKKIIEYTSKDKQNTNQQTSNLINIIAERDENERRKILDLTENVKTLSSKLDKLIDAMHENSSAFVQTIARDETNFKHLMKNMEEIKNSQSKIHDRIDNISEKINEISVKTDACLIPKQK